MELLPTRDSPEKHQTLHIENKCNNNWPARITRTYRLLTISIRFGVLLNKNHTRIQGNWKTIKHLNYRNNDQIICKIGMDVSVQKKVYIEKATRRTFEWLVAGVMVKLEGKRSGDGCFSWTNRRDIVDRTIVAHAQRINLIIFAEISAARYKLYSLFAQNKM